GAATSPWMRQAERLLHVGFHPNGKVLITAGYLSLGESVGIVQTWDLERSAPGDLRLSVYARQVRPAAFTPAGPRVMRTAPLSANVWDRALRRDAVSINHRAKLLHTAFSPDGSRVGVGSEAGFSVWDTAAGDIVPYDKHQRPGQRYVNQVAFNHDG